MPLKSIEKYSGNRRRIFSRDSRARASGAEADMPKCTYCASFVKASAVAAQHIDFPWLLMSQMGQKN